MNPWIETIGITAVALLALWLVRLLLRTPGWLQMVIYSIPLGIIALLLWSRFDGSVAFESPFCWVVAGRTRFVFVALAVTMGLAMPLPRLPRRWEKVASGVFMAAVLIWFSIMPFLMPAIIRPQLACINTRIDRDGICRQSTPYTCGPAAAVTALMKLGIAADEGSLAMMARTSPIVGTVPERLSSVLSKNYGNEGLHCSYRRFESVAQLADAGLTLAVLRDRPMVDHCVTVLQVSPDSVTIADPSLGLTTMQRSTFERMWRFRGIVVSRDGAEG